MLFIGCSRSRKSRAKLSNVIVICAFSAMTKKVYQIVYIRYFWLASYTPNWSFNDLVETILLFQFKCKWTQMEFDAWGGSRSFSFSSITRSNTINTHVKLNDGTAFGTTGRDSSLWALYCLSQNTGDGPALNENLKYNHAAWSLSLRLCLRVYYY